MELRHLRYFLAVADEANFTRAAARLGIAQPPLSQQIRDLEQELGVALFTRTPHGAVLTEAGSLFRDEAQQILAHVDDATVIAQRAARGEFGQLRIAFTSSSAFNPVVPSAIRNFRRAYPHVHLILSETNTLRLLEGLATHQIDVAFIRPGVGDVASLRLHRYADEPMMVVLPQSHPLANADRLPLAALARDPFVLFPRAMGLSLYDEVMSACRLAGFEPVMSQEAPQMSSIVNLVAAELGVSIVPAAVSQVQVRGVRYVAIDGPAPIARLALATRPDESSAVVKHFVALATGEEP